MNFRILVSIIAFILISCGHSSETPKTFKLSKRQILVTIDPPVLGTTIRKIDKDEFAKEDSMFIKNNPDAWPPSRITFYAEKDDSVMVKMYDVKGNMVDQLFSGFLERGHYLITPVASYPVGVYFINYKIGSESFTKKYIVNK